MTRLRARLAAAVEPTPPGAAAGLAAHGDIRRRVPAGPLIGSGSEAWPTYELEDRAGHTSRPAVTRKL